MKFKSLKQDKGVAGLTILLSLIVMLFIIGLIVMVFTLMGAGLRDSDALTAEVSSEVLQTEVNVTSEGVNLTSCAGDHLGTITIASLQESTNASVADLTDDYVIDTCTVATVVGGEYERNETLFNITYTYTYAGESWRVINETGSAITDVTDWFGIFIVIGSMVVLILLTVIIITAIRGSGMIVESSNAKGTIGSA